MQISLVPRVSCRSTQVININMSSGQSQMTTQVLNNIIALKSPSISLKIYMFIHNVTTKDEQVYK